jgi:membrane protease YdiL (CAAX protease family)
VIDLELPPPPRAPPLTVALLLTLTVFGLFLVLGASAQELNLSVGVWFTEVLIFLGVPVVALRVLGRDPVRETGADSTSLKALGLGALIGLANYLAWAVPLMAVAQHLLPKKLVELFDGSQIFLHQSGLELVLLVAGLGLAAPVCEEFFFRGMLQRGLMKRVEPSMAIVLTALVFSAFHLDPVGFLARFELGVVFGLLAWRSGSIWPGVAAHAANNLVAASLFFLSADEAEADLDWGVLFGLFLGGNVLLGLVLAWARGRLAAPRPASDEQVPPVGLFRAAWPWLAAGVISLGGVLLFDQRGIHLRLHEATHPLPARVARDPQLEALRKNARRGEVPLEDYFEARRLAAPATTTDD